MATHIAIHLERSDARRWLKDNFTFKGARDGVPLLLVLCSRTGRRDMRGQLFHRLPLGLRYMQVEYAFVSFGSPQTCAEQIEKHVARYSPDLLAIVRGGGDAGQIAAVADSELVVRTLLRAGLKRGEYRPYYSAVGHNHDRTLVDHYSDESFHTPTALGEELASIELDLRRRARESGRVRRLGRCLACSLAMNLIVGASLYGVLAQPHRAAQWHRMLEQFSPAARTRS